MRMDTLKPDRCEIRGENFHWQGDALVIGIGNGRQAGGGQQLCPEALINDGLLHLRIFTGEELIPALFSTLANPENSPNIVDGVSSWFEITAPHEMTFNLDGEPLSGKTFRMELLPAALRCRCRPTAAATLRRTGAHCPAALRWPAYGSQISCRADKRRAIRGSQPRPGQAAAATRQKNRFGAPPEPFPRIKAINGA